MLVVLTFDHPHRKTQDLLCKLMATGQRPLVVATEWVARKNFKPIIAHRPGNAMDISLSDFCRNLGLDLVKTTKAELAATLREIASIEYILLATGNIIEEEIVTSYKVINSHPGYLPLIKGLDALKWAILYRETIGVTTHFVNEQIDGGVIIERQKVPFHYEDSFHNLAYRQYEMEVDMLVASIHREPENIPITESQYHTFRRMPHRLENRMLETFEALRQETDFRTQHLKSEE
jgi:folate-dependent phosphoribosylglycinamide formyltransferase PurN